MTPLYDYTRGIQGGRLASPPSDIISGDIMGRVWLGQVFRSEGLMRARTKART